MEAIPDRRYKAVLRQVIPTADRTKATVQVKVTILEKDKDLKPEMSAKVTFLEPEKKEADAGGRGARRAASPQDAVVARATARRSSSWCARAGRRRASVTHGRGAAGAGGDQEGLAGGEIVISRPPETLKDGDAVRVKGRG